MGASAPAITAGFTQLGSSLQSNPSAAYSGAMYYRSYYKYLAGGNSDYAYDGGFSASRSSSIYGASDTIRPISKEVRFILRY